MHFIEKWGRKKKKESKERNKNDKSAFSCFPQDIELSAEFLKTKKQKNNAKGSKLTAFQ